MKCTRAMLPWALVLAAACGGGPAEPPAPGPLSVQRSQEFELPMGRTAHVTGSELRLTLLDVAEDSRCPIDAVCVWQGNARAVLQARLGESGAAETLSLNTGVAPDEAVTQGFTVRLRGVLPAARANVTTPMRDYVAVLVVDGP